MSESRKCAPSCKHFVCETRPPSLKLVSRRGQRLLWCRMVDDECDGPWCQYASCDSRRMTSEGLCRSPVKHVDDLDEDVYVEKFVDPASIPKKYAKKLGVKGN